MIVENRASHGRVQILAHDVDGLGVVHVLIVVGMRQVDHFAGVAQTNRGQRFHFTHFECDHHFVDVGKRASFTLRARLRFCQVIQAKHHVLRRNGDGLS